MATTGNRLVQELQAVGLEVTDVWQLVRMRAYPEAIPVLIRWVRELPDAEPPSAERDRLLEGIVRALSVPEARPVAAEPLMDLFPKTAGPLQWIVGNAIEVTASAGQSDRLLDLVENKDFGSSRQMLVLALRRVAKKNPRTLKVLRRCVDDDTVVSQAMTVLASVDPQTAVQLVEPKVRHSDPAVAAAARRTLKAASKKIKSA